MMNTFIIMMPIFAMAGALLVRFWRTAVLMVVIAALAEGAIRKWVLPGFQAQIHFAKDAILICACIGFLIENPPRLVHARLQAVLKGLLGLSVIYFAAQMFNPGLPTPLIGLLGFKNYLLYATLAFLVPYTASTIPALRGQLTGFALIAIPIAVLGLVQFSLSPDHWLNSYVQQDVTAELSIATFGEGIELTRTTGTFAFISGFVTFLMAAFLLAFALVLAGGRMGLSVLAAFLLLSVALAAAFTTGSRTALVGTIGVAPLAFILAARNLASGPALIRTVLLLAAASALALVYGADAVGAFTLRTISADSNLDRFLSPFVQLEHAMSVSSFMGVGIGATAGGAWVLAGASGADDLFWLGGQVFEEETARIYQEVGAIGFLLTYLTRLSILGVGLMVVWRVHQPLLRALAAAIVAFLTFHLFTAVMLNTTAGIFFWYAAGLLFLAYRLDVESRARSFRAARAMQAARAAAAPDLADAGPARA